MVACDLAHAYGMQGSLTFGDASMRPKVLVIHSNALVDPFNHPRRLHTLTPALFDLAREAGIAVHILWNMLDVTMVSELSKVGKSHMHQDLGADIVRQVARIQRDYVLPNCTDDEVWYLDVVQNRLLMMEGAGATSVDLSPPIRGVNVGGLCGFIGTLREVVANE